VVAEVALPKTQMVTTTRKITMRSMTKMIFGLWLTNLKTRKMRRMKMRMRMILHGWRRRRRRRRRKRRRRRRMTMKKITVMTMKTTPSTIFTGIRTPF